METLQDYLSQNDEHEANKLFIEKLQISEEIDKTREGIKRGIELTRRSTGLDASNGNITNLASGIAGERKDTGIFIDQQLIESGNKNIDHVIVHENMHEINARKSKESILNPNGVKLHEGITELASERVTGRRIAYAAEVSEVLQFANNSGESVNKIISLYKEGRNKEINEIIKSVYSDDYKQQIAA